MSDSRVKVTITVIAKAFERSTARIIYHIHRPHDVDEGAACFECMEPWPCQKLRDFEARNTKEADCD